MKVASLLKQGRKDKRFTQAAVEELTGINKKTLANYENGHYQPNLETILKLFELYGIDAYETLGITIPGAAKKVPVLSTQKIYDNKEEVLMANNAIYFEYVEVDKSENYLCFQVSDDTLKDFRILTNDLLLVKTVEKPVDGNIVAALVNGRVIFRKFQRIREGVFALTAGEFSGSSTTTYDTNDSESAQAELLGVVKKIIVTMP